MADEWEDTLAAVGTRLRALRQENDVTLTALAESTDVSVSTLSRLESGDRKPTLELLLPLAKAYGVSLDELVDAPPTGDPRVNLRPIKHHGMTSVPLSNKPGGIQTYKTVIEAGKGRKTPDPQTHEGYEWLYIITGRLRLILANHDLILEAGEAAEFDTRTPHWFGAADDGAVEFLSMFGPQGERVHVRAKPKKLA